MPGALGRNRREPGAGCPGKEPQGTAGNWGLLRQNGRNAEGSMVVKAIRQVVLVKIRRIAAAGMKSGMQE